MIFLESTNDFENCVHSPLYFYPEFTRQVQQREAQFTLHQAHNHTKLQDECESKHDPPLRGLKVSHQRRVPAIRSISLIHTEYLNSIFLHSRITRIDRPTGARCPGPDRKFAVAPPPSGRTQSIGRNPPALAAQRSGRARIIGLRANQPRQGWRANPGARSVKSGSTNLYLTRTIMRAD